MTPQLVILSEHLRNEAPLAHLQNLDARIWAERMPNEMVSRSLHEDEDD